MEILLGWKGGQKDREGKPSYKAYCQESENEVKKALEEIGRFERLRPKSRDHFAGQQFFFSHFPVPLKFRNIFQKGFLLTLWR